MDTLDEARWRAVVERDAAADGLFVYAVRTTGVFCRPVCRSRRPKRENVEFFLSPDEARAHRFRACSRCRPGESRPDAATEALVRVCGALEDGASVSDVAALAREVGLSERHLRRLFREVLGVTPGEYARSVAARHAREALADGSSVAGAALDAGYGSMRGFYEDAAPQLGMTPSRFRDGGRGEVIRFTTVDTPLGLVVVAATSRGVCAVRFVEDESAALTEVSAEFPNAQIERDDDGLAGPALVLADAVDGRRVATSLPLDVSATAFQARVWTALREIPAGETLSYSALAERIGRPSAVRAVASACAANPVAVTVPCHRVVRHDGSLGGYRWGVATKQSLLASEAAAAGASG